MPDVLKPERDEVRPRVTCVATVVKKNSEYFSGVYSRWNNVASKQQNRWQRCRSMFRKYNIRQMLIRKVVMIVVKSLPEFAVVVVRAQSVSR